MSLAAIGLMALSAGMRAFAGSFGLLLSRAVTGLGTGMAFAGNVLMVAAASPAATRVRDQGIRGAVQSLGIVAAMLLVPIVNVTVGLPPFYLAVAVLGAVFLTLFALSFPVLAPAVARPAGKVSLLAAFRSRPGGADSSCSPLRPC